MNFDSINDKPREACGVFGIFNHGFDDTQSVIHKGLESLQHRGQESAGLAISHQGKINCHKDVGMVKEVFGRMDLNSINGMVGIGHVRYSTTAKKNSRQNAQPLVYSHKGIEIALAHNGHIVDGDRVRNELIGQGYEFNSETDSEVILNLIIKHYHKGLKNAVISAVMDLKGAISMTMISGDILIGIRDPLGLRPLCIGRLGTGFVLASESCGLHEIGASYVREVENGELVIIDKDGLESFIYSENHKKATCSFEYVYFSSPQSILGGKSVLKTRERAGVLLAIQSPAPGDIVVGVPESGSGSARGYSRELKIPYVEALLDHKDSSRTFIQPSQDLRCAEVKKKFDVVEDQVNGKNIVLVDDSIVRGTTMNHIVELLKSKGAREVHVRISSPQIKYPCYFGVDIPDSSKLASSVNEKHELCTSIGADSLEFLSLDRLYKSVGCGESGLCTSCFDGNYPS